MASNSNLLHEKRKVNIIIPVYNAQNSLGHCLNSVLAQTYPHWTAILVDDGSRDSSLEICQNYAAIDPRFQVISKPNGGVSSARNAGLELAQGDYLVFLDSDDCLAQDALEKQVDLAVSNQSQLVVTNALMIDFHHPQENRIMLNSNWLKKSPCQLSAEEFRKKRMRLIWFTALLESPWAKLYDLKLWKQLDLRFPKELSLGEDFVTNMKYYDACNGAVFLNECCYYYNQFAGSGSLTDKYRPDLFETKMYLMEKLEEHLGGREKLSAYELDAFYCYAASNGLGSVENVILTSGLKGSQLLKRVQELFAHPLFAESIRCATYIPDRFAGCIEAARENDLETVIRHISGEAAKSTAQAEDTEAEPSIASNSSSRSGLLNRAIRKVLRTVRPLLRQSDAGIRMSQLESRIKQYGLKNTFWGYTLSKHPAALHLYADAAPEDSVIREMIFSSSSQIQTAVDKMTTTASKIWESASEKTSTSTAQLQSTIDKISSAASQTWKTTSEKASASTAQLQAVVDEITTSASQTWKSASEKTSASTAQLQATVDEITSAAAKLQRTATEQTAASTAQLQTAANEISSAVVELHNIASKNSSHSLDQIQKNITDYAWLSEQRQTRYAYLRDINELRQRKKVIMLATAEHANIGDAAITLAEQDVLSKQFPEYFQAEISTYEFKQKEAFLHAILNPEDILVINGGGNIGDLYAEEEELHRKIVAEFPNNKIIIFPQTISFMDVEGSELAKSAAVYNAHPDLTLFVRGETSLAFAKKHFTNVRTFLMPDVVHMLQTRYSLNRSGVLLCLRNDGEGKLKTEDKTLIAKTAALYHLAIDSSTNIHSEDIPRDMRGLVVRKELMRFASQQLVITDRLHGMIFSAVTGTPCIVLASYNHKIREYYDAFLHGSNAVFFIGDDMNKLDDTIREALQVTDVQYPVFAKQSLEQIRSISME